MLKRALPPVVLFLSACTSPASPEAARAPAAASPTAQVIDRKPAPQAPPPVGGARVEAAPQAPPVIDRKPMPEAAAPVVAADPTRALFVANCAQCHGEKGDGEGVTQLDRKARSFLEGGFSYGNTKDAIVRSITHGIPGTPMPSFEKALASEQRAALADYVIALGPERLVVDPSESEMVVTDKPLVVRGKLPPLVEGGPEIPRGLAIGTPDGLTFEYRADDVQLLAVRAGRFVNRTDWNDRGGQALEMLSKPVYVLPSYPPLISFRSGRDTRGDSAFEAEWDVPATCRLSATVVEGTHAMVEYEARPKSIQEGGSVHVLEEVSGFQCEFGSGFVRRLVLRGTTADITYRVTMDGTGPGQTFMVNSQWDDVSRPRWVCRYPTAGSPGQLQALVSDRGTQPKNTPLTSVILNGSETAHVALYCIPTPTVPSDGALAYRAMQSCFGRSK